MFDYSDNIHFVGYQLDHYYGTNNWPWRMCAEVTGVSISTVRKYYNQQWEVEQEKFDLINQALNKLDFSNREIKLLTTQKEQYFAVDGHYEIKVIPFPKETPIEEKRIHKELKTKFPIHPNIKIELPDKAGLYLLCQIVSPAHLPSTRFYLVKVGKSTNLHKRVNAYNGMNPFASCVDYKRYPPSQVDNAEIRYHEKMEKKWTRQGNTEWFVVPESDYVNILAKGFDAL